MEILKNISLAPYTTFRAGGNAKEMVIAKSRDDLTRAIKHAKENSLDIFILGGGSNILISDEGFPGLVIQMAILEVSFEDGGDRVTAVVSAGVDWDGFVAESVGRGLYGLENLSGIPGTVGAAPVQDIGAYGSELRDVFVSLETINVNTLEIKSLSKEECRFGYRDSIFKSKENSNLIILSVTMELLKKGTVNISYKDLAAYFKDREVSDILPAQVREAVLSIRARKLPDPKKLGTVGSFFKNPLVGPEKKADLHKKYPELPTYPDENGLTKVSAAWLIDKVCGLKGLREGDVGTYEHQPLAIVNYGKAKAKEIYDFAKKIEKIVFDTTGVRLEWEVRRVGKF